MQCHCFLTLLLLLFFVDGKRQKKDISRKMKDPKRLSGSFADTRSNKTSTTG